MMNWLRVGSQCAIRAGMLVALASGSFVLAEETVGRWRFEVHVGGVTPGGQLRSKADNVMVVESSELDVQIGDPRPDKAALNEGRLSSTTRFDARVSYGLFATKRGEVYIDAGFAYYKVGVRNVELTYSLDRQDADFNSSQIPDGSRGRSRETDPGCSECLPFSSDDLSENWKYEPLTPGDVRLIPISIDLMVRLQPSKRFNPYFGAGIGYIFADFQQTRQWKNFADQMDASVVDYVIKPPDSPLTQRALVGAPHDLKRPEIAAPDSLFWEGRAGLEWQWKPKTAFFADVRFNWASNNIRVLVDGREQFGKATPSIRVKESDPRVFPAGGRPAYIIRGGLKRSVPDAGLGPWPGEYYLNGGQLKYGGWAFSVGLRFTI